MTVYYNEFDPFKAQWLRHLIEEGVIAKGFVDERPIQSVEPIDLIGYDQHHFFAGIGVHSYALRRAGWDDDVPIWTGSCPCGPFSVAGLQKGFADPRHLWPEWFRLVSVCRPGRILGEQVADASAWIDLVQSDLESHGYAFGAPDLPAAGFSGAHRRQRFFFMADADNTEWWSERAPWNDGKWPTTGRIESHSYAGKCGGTDGLADGAECGRSRVGNSSAHDIALQDEQASGVEQPTSFGRGKEREDGIRHRSGSSSQGRPSGPELGSSLGRLGGRWDAGALPQAEGSARWGVWRFSNGPQPSGPADWIFCRDGNWRPVEPGTFPLVDASPQRVGRLRGYGDAIDAEALTQFVSAYMDALYDIF